MSDWNVVKAADTLRQGDRIIFGEEIGGENEVVTVESISTYFATTEIQTEELDFTIDVIGSQPVRMAPETEKLVPHPKAELVRKEYEKYRKRVDPGEDFPTVIADMIADLLHLGDAMAAAATEEGEDWDPTDTVDRAMSHYTAERDGDDIELSSRESGYYS